MQTNFFTSKQSSKTLIRLLRNPDSPHGDIDRVFTYFDADGDGQIDVQEMKLFTDKLVKYGTKEEKEEAKDFQAYFAKIDRDDDGFVTLEEFREFFGSQKS
jgi:Ca2+-binding EF-hand superfamily protein